MDGRAILHTQAHVLPELDEPICIGECDYVPKACHKARKRKEEEALEFMANALPSLLPSPPPMHTDDEHDEPGGAGPSELPEGHKLEAGKMLQRRQTRARLMPPTMTSQLWHDRLATTSLPRHRLSRL
eukprot:2982338-Pleurochrysis_carterae.AAC.1